MGFRNSGLFIILNEFLQTGLIVGKDVKELLIDARCHNIEFIPNGKGYDIRYTPIDSEERKRVEPKLRKKFKLFKISSRKSSNLFLKTIKKQYAKKDRIQFICDLFNSDEAKTVINLRNEIVHRRPLSARFSLAPNELVPGVSVRMNPEGWYDYATLPQLLEKNLFVVRDAIKILYELIFYNDVPNSKENETKRFEALVVRCKPCNKEILINSLSTDYLIKIAHPLICPTCKSDNTEIVNRMKVHERFFFSNFWNYSDFLIQYWESTEVNSKL
jgi:Zn finger protein HypA/HybF involved in hydrogenase expression